MVCSLDPRVTVITAVYNRAHQLESALLSTAAQTLPPFEMIVVNDGSTDGSGAVARRFADRIPNLRVIEQSNAGPGVARNRALELARGDWIAFLDSDDTWTERKLAGLAECLARNPRAEFVHTDRSYRFPDGTLRPSSNFPVARMVNKEFLFSAFAIKTSTVAVARALVDRTAARFAEDQRTCEDYQFFWTCLAAAREISYLNRPDTVVFETPGSLTRSDNAAEIWRDNIKIISRLCREPLAPALRRGLEALRYRCSQGLLEASNREGVRFGREYAFLAAHLGYPRVVRTYASVLSALCAKKLKRATPFRKP